MHLLTRFSSAVGGMAPTVRRRRVVRFPRNSIESRLQKHLEKFERDPTAGYIAMDILTRFSSVVGGMGPTGRRLRVVPIPRNSIENSLRKLVKNISARSNGGIYSYGSFDPVL